MILKVNIGQSIRKEKVMKHKKMKQKRHKLAKERKNVSGEPGRNLTAAGHIKKGDHDYQTNEFRNQTSQRNLAAGRQFHRGRYLRGQILRGVAKIVYDAF